MKYENGFTQYLGDCAGVDCDEPKRIKYIDLKIMDGGYMQGYGYCTIRCVKTIERTGKIVALDAY